MITPTELYRTLFGQKLKIEYVWGLQIMLKQRFDEIVFLDPPRKGIH